MLISLESVPIVALGMENSETCLMCPVSQRRICSSLNSCAPPPEPITTPTSRLASMSMAAKSTAASCSASVPAATASGTTRPTCLRSFASIHLDSSKSCISPAICTGKSLGSKRVTRLMPLFPARMARQNASLPMPLGLTQPIPVITTRLDMSQRLYPSRHSSREINP